MALRDSFAVLLVLSGTAMPGSANDDTAWGRMICEVVDSRIILADDTHPGFGSRLREDFSTGTEFHFEYGLDDASELTIYLGEAATRNVLIDERFLASNFKGVSRLTNYAEFRAAFSEATFGQYRINYKGSDQLFLKNRCDGEEWSGHFVRTHLSGLFTQVVSLECRTFVDARDDVFARLSAVR